MKFKTVWLWPLIDTLNSSIDWDNLRERLSVTTTVHYVLFYIAKKIDIMTFFQILMKLISIPTVGEPFQL